LHYDATAWIKKTSRDLLSSLLDLAKEREALAVGRRGAGGKLEAALKDLAPEQVFSSQKLRFN